MTKDRHHFQAKLMKSYSIFMLAMILFSTVYWVVQLYSEQNSSLINQLSLLAKQGSTVIDVALSRAKPVLYMHVKNELIEKVLCHEAEEETSSFDSSNLYYLEQGALQQNPDLLSIIFVSLNGNAYSSQKNALPHSAIAEYISLAQNRNGIPYIGALHYESINGEKEHVLPVYKELISIATGRSIGYVIINLDFSRLCNNIEVSTALSEGYYTMIADGEEPLYLSNVNHGLWNSLGKDFLLSDIQSISDGSHSYYYYKNHAVCVYGIPNSSTGWTIYKFFNVRQYSSDSSMRIILYVSISFICFCIMVLIATGVSKRLSSNINLLHHAFSSSADTNLEKINTAKIRKDEIGDLIVSFNHMVDRLNDSIEKEYAATIHAQDMQIKMLNYQINPHFLYNCLNLISSLAIIHNVPEIARISHVLGEMFHYSIESRNIVRIRDEMNHIIDYLEIQKVRFPGQFHVDYDIDSTLLDEPCMKFILQPIVENSFSHGFLPSAQKKDNRMLIRVLREEDQILFSVKDNGNGIDAETLRAIRENLYSSSDNTASGQGSIGLWNIHKRIETYYGRPYGLQIESEFGKYTRVTLLFPLSDKKNPPRQAD